MNRADTINDLLEDFSFFTDWEERYLHVIDMGKALPPLPAKDKIQANKVQGCASQVWLSCQTDPHTQNLIFTGESDAHIVQGLIAIILTIYSNRTASEILAIDAEPIFAQLGLAEHLTSQRANGMRAMVKTIKAYAQTILKSDQP